MPDDVRSEGDPEADVGVGLRRLREALATMDAHLTAVLARAATGREGFITREWGFITPGGLGVPLGGKFAPLEKRLAGVATFFPEPAAYTFFQDHPLEMSLPPRLLGPGQRERLAGHAPLHAYLVQAPSQPVSLTEADLSDYRQASKLFILLGSLAHLCANSAPERTPLPTWLAEPFLRVAARLDVHPALTGHFLVVDNWQWRADCDPGDFRVENLALLYPCFGHDHERVYHTVPACMAHAMAALPHTLHDAVRAMLGMVSARVRGEDDQSSVAFLVSLLHQIATMLTSSKEQFQRITSIPGRSTHVSKYVFIRHMQPLHKGVTLHDAHGQLITTKGMSGLQFVFYHLLDAFLGRYHHGTLGELASMEQVDAYYPPLQRAFSAALMPPIPSATLRGFLSTFDAPPSLRRAFNRVLEAYAGEDGVLAAHSRKLLNYMHNNLQVDTAAEGGQAQGVPTRALNHATASHMHGVMEEALRERRRLRLVPVFVEVEKEVVSARHDDGYADISLHLDGTGLRYERGDIVRVLLPRDTGEAESFRARFFPRKQTVALADLPHAGTAGWSWAELFELLGWDPQGAAVSDVCRYIGHDPGERRANGNPASGFEPVQPRVYSTCGVEPGAARLLVTIPRDIDTHCGFQRITDLGLRRVPIAFSPCTAFLRPLADANLLLVATGTGVTPFVGFVRALADHRGPCTLVHQCRTEALFRANLETWLTFTREHPDAVVIGCISGSRGGTQAPLTLLIRNGGVAERIELDPHDPAAYYFVNPHVLRRLDAVAQSRCNLAYCCGGSESAVRPLQRLCGERGWRYEIIPESHSVDQSLEPDALYASLEDRLLNLSALRDIHPGGLDLIQQLVTLERERLDQAGCDGPVDLSRIFAQVHPHAYNLLRVAGAASDEDFEAFADFVDSEAQRGVVLDVAAQQYVAVALAHPARSRVLKIAIVLQTRAIDAHLRKGSRVTPEDIASADRCLQNMEALIPRVSEEDPDARRFHDDLRRFRTALSSPTFVFDVQRGAFVASSVARGVEGVRVLMQYDGSVTVLTMEGRLDTASADAAWAQWSALIADGHDRFVVDLSGLAYASSMGLRVLIRGAKAATVVAFGLTPFLANIFLICGLSRLIPVFDGLAEARADLIARAHRHRADDSPSS